MLIKLSAKKEIKKRRNNSGLRGSRMGFSLFTLILQPLARARRWGKEMGASSRKNERWQLKKCSPPFSLSFLLFCLFAHPPRYLLQPGQSAWREGIWSHKDMISWDKRSEGLRKIAAEKFLEETKENTYLFCDINGQCSVNIHVSQPHTSE